MSGHVAWSLELTVKPGRLDELRVLVDDLVESAQGEPGTLMYELSISEDGSVVHSYERFADSDAALAHFARFGENFLQRYLAAVDTTRVVVYGTPSAAVKEATAAFQPTYMQPLAGFAR
ncbi:MAG TPA: antibiotic biosynthesis monooxygenase family protein [Gaiellaceae bacterium]|jgi:quinol monooxygenase YgiN